MQDFRKFHFSQQSFAHTLLAENGVNIVEKVFEMKFSAIITFAVLICFQQRLWSQDGMALQPLISDHETINTVKINYKAVSQSSANADPELRMIAIPQATIALKEGSEVSRIYFQINNLKNDSILYQSDYSVNSSTTLNGDGLTVFDNLGGSYFISNGNALALKPYVYSIQTANSQGVKSTVFKIIQ
jgi:hypothetical protein